MACTVSIFVYIDTASAVNNLACGGRGPRSWMLRRMANESLMFVLKNVGRSFFIWWSNHLEKMLAKLLTQDTTGRVDQGILCTFGVM
jgi:hypothetical protein